MTTPYDDLAAKARAAEAAPGEWPNEFTVAASPSVVLALLARLRRLEEVAEAGREMAEAGCDEEAFDEGVNRLWAALGALGGGE